MAAVILSSILHEYANKQDKLEIKGKTLFAVMIQMIQSYPNLRRQLFDINGELTKSMNFYLNDKNIPEKNWENIPVKASDKISILYAGRSKSGKAVQSIKISDAAHITHQKHEELNVLNNQQKPMQSSDTACIK